MMELKSYQKEALRALEDFLHRVRVHADAGEAHPLDRAYREVAGRYLEHPPPYQEPGGLEGIPYVCFRIPTGGGKTLLAAHALAPARRFLGQDAPAVVWLTPTEAIRAQTLRALKDPQHPYRQGLEAALGPARVMDLQEALALTPGDVGAVALVLVATLQAFRVEATEGRKVYEDNGHLMAVFRALEEASSPPEGVGRYSLANLLRLMRPIVVVDEAHNARTPLSFDTLARLEPGVILEFTATPREDSNVLFAATAHELHREGMIKLPIELVVLRDREAVLQAALAKRAELEALARGGREYLRPILLVQAEPRRGQDSFTWERAYEFLLEQGVREEEVAVSTGERDDLTGQDLLSPSSPVRYVITVDRLKEGWDCPFAYVLASVRPLRSSTAIEQVLGRVLRMPGAKPKEREELNRAYAFAVSEDFWEAANALREALVLEGFERYEAERAVRTVGLPLEEYIPLKAPPKPGVLEVLKPKVAYDPKSKTLVLKEPLTPSERAFLREGLAEEDRQRLPQTVRPPSEEGRVLEVPLLAWHGEPLEAEHFLEEGWSLAGRDARLDFVPGPLGARGEIGVEGGRVRIARLEGLDRAGQLFGPHVGWTRDSLALWLDRHIPHPDLPQEETLPFIYRALGELLGRYGLEDLVAEKRRLRDLLEAKIRAHREAARKEAFQRLLKGSPPDLGTLTLRLEGDYFPPNPYRGAYVFRKHFFPVIADLEDGTEEFQCARLLDELEEVEFWVRNYPTWRHAFRLPYPGGNFFPDFLAKLRNGTLLVVEYKGEHLAETPETYEKEAIGRLWAQKTGNRFLMVRTLQGLDALRQAVRL
ncbi:DEAD/DEAH box helicase [Thermus sp.]|uniref:DEAD/DEAH box helicase n=1 Tax=Thermus sp. TaxID=275 RepID=UPI003D104823